jgi:hypothetical protein
MFPAHAVVADSTRCGNFQAREPAAEERCRARFRAFPEAQLIAERNHPIGKLTPFRPALTIKHTSAMATAAPFKVWKTITRGTRHKTAEDFRAALQAAGCYLGDSADDILGSAAFRCADQESELDLVVRSVADLGLGASASYQNICARACELGLELCPAEVGPQLRLQYLNQPFTHWLQIAMEPLIHSSGRFVIFSVDRSFGGRYLGTRYSSPDGICYSPQRFVFAKPR